jgi:hypothetical protein
MPYLLVRMTQSEETSGMTEGQTVGEIDTSHWWIIIKI